MALSLLAVCGWRQVSFWRDSETVWSHSVACEPRNLTARHRLAVTLFSLGRDNDAAAQFRKNHEIDPSYNLGDFPVATSLTFIRDQQRTEIAEYREALLRQPDSVDIRLKLAWRLATSPVQSLATPTRRFGLPGGPSNSAGVVGRTFSTRWRPPMPKPGSLPTRPSPRGKP